MSDLMVLIRAQARVATFLASLTLERLVALADGRVSLAVVEKSSGAEASELIGPPAAPADSPRRRRATSAPPRPAPGLTNGFDAVTTAADLRNCASIDEGTELLAALNLKVTELRALAKALNISSTGNKPELSRKILMLALGSRSKHAALRHG